MKLYVLVRNDLSPAQRMVQAAHAVAELALLECLKGWENETIVILGVDDLDALHGWHDVLLDTSGSAFAWFEEPYFNDEMTAISVVCKDGDISELFSELNLCII